METINELRNEIDAVDAELVKLLNKRLETCVKIAGIKRQAGIEMYDAGREAEIIENARKDGGDSAASLMNVVIGLCKRAQSDSAEG